MTNPPKDISPQDADRILRLAAELEGKGDARGLSREDLRSIAAEAGFSRHAVERAMTDVLDSELISVVRPPVQQSGLFFMHLTAVREIPASMTSEQLMRVVQLFHPYREGPARITLEDQEIVWRDRKGLQFAVTSGSGVTILRVYVSKLILRRGRWKSWVKAAADRLEMLTLAVARQDRARPALPSPPPSEPGAIGP